MATTNLNLRVDADVKRNAEALYNELGLTLSAAVNIFLRQSIRESGLPFDLRIAPDAETLAALDDARNLRNLSGPYNSLEELMEDVNNA